MLPINNCLLRLSKRAETYDTEHLSETFVDVGPLFTLLSNQDNQILYGRRGTGKTHVLSYLVTQVVNGGEMAAQIDMRTMGSTGGIYSDSRIPLTERATRLLVDTLNTIHDKILERVLAQEDVFDLSQIGPTLDRFAEATSQVIVVGDVSQERIERNESSECGSTTLGLGISFSGPSAQVDASLADSCTQEIQVSERRTGNERLRVHFGRVGQEFQNVLHKLPNQKFWLMLDEWSEVPLDLQPYLADLLRRTLFPIRGVSVKIAAIEQRCNFRVDYPEIGHIGIEVGADAATSLNLDEFMVFDNDADAAKEFFKQLLYKHVRAILSASGQVVPTNAFHFIREAFTQGAAFDEFVRSAEGVPRDAINIVGIAAQKALNNRISVSDIRESARTWYHRAKEQAITSKTNAVALLRWIIDEVISHRQAKAFLVSSGFKNELIDYLYDARILHLIKYGVSAQDQPGQRFNVYAIDYGCYVDLITTNRAPRGLFEIDQDEHGNGRYVQVPPTDFRSIRRAILDFSDFERTLAFQGHSGQA